MAEYELRAADEQDRKRAVDAREFRGAASPAVIVIALVQAIPTGVALGLTGGTDAAVIVFVTALGSLVLTSLLLGVGSWLASRRVERVEQRIRDRSAAAAGEAALVGSGWVRIEVES